MPLPRSLLVVATVLTVLVVSWRLNRRARGRPLLVEQARLLAPIATFSLVSGLMRLDGHGIPEGILQFAYVATAAISLVAFIGTLLR
jgi:hypothetical protein